MVTRGLGGVVCLILLMLPSSSWAQSSDSEDLGRDVSVSSREESVRPMRHFLGIHGSAFVHWMRDDVFSPLAYRGADWGGRLHYEYRGDWNHHFVVLQGGFGRPGNAVDPAYVFLDDDNVIDSESVETMQVQGYAQYAYHRILRNFANGRFRFGVGAIIDASMTYLESYQVTWLGAYALNVSTQLSMQLSERHLLVARIYIPFFAFLSRPPWSVYNDRIMDNHPALNAFEGGFTSFHEFFRLSADLRYEVLLNERVRMSFIYELTYVHVTEPEPMDAIRNNFMIGVTPAFRGRR